MTQAFSLYMFGSSFIPFYALPC